MIEPTPLTPRYFLHPEGGLQAVHNLSDPAPYLEAGYDEVDEDTYRVAVAAADTAASAGLAAGDGA